MTAMTSLAFAVFGVLPNGAVHAQVQTQAPIDFTTNTRTFPKNVSRGEMLVKMAPDVVMDGKPDRFSPGVRIRDTQNNLVLSGNLANVPLVVNYTRDNTGLVHMVWVLSREEAKQRLPGQAPGGLEGIISNVRSAFDTPEPTDDGKTPFNQLPRYKQ